LQVKKFTFSKKERLCRKKYIQELFEDGSSFFLHPFKVHYHVHKNTDIDNIQILISVPKKFYKKAIDRNLIKRRVREVYRLNKHILNDISINKLFIAYIYVGREILPYNEMLQKLKQALFRLKEEVDVRN